MHGGYGICYDRVTLEIESLERGLDGRALPIEVRAGNDFFIDPATGTFPPFAPSSQQSVYRVHPAGGRRMPGSTSSTTACRTRPSNSSTWAFSAGCRNRSSCASTASTISARISSSAGR